MFGVPFFPNLPIYQEVKGVVLEGSEGTYKVETCPWFPVRMYSCGNIASWTSKNATAIETIIGRTVILTIKPVIRKREQQNSQKMLTIRLM